MIFPNGTESKTTFWSDFTIADAFGIDAIEDTFKRAFKEWKTDVEYITELSIVMNLKTWYHYERNNDVYSKLYADLYYKVDGWCKNHLKGKDFEYYFNMTD